jgi:DNA-binding transcriptional MerR regulator
MNEEGTRRNSQNQDAEGSASGGWTNTTTAGKALGVSPRTIQTYIRKGLLQGKVEGEGVRRTWYVSIDSLNTLRAQRLAEGGAETFREGSAERVAEGIAEAMQNLSERLAEEAARAAEYRVRLELTERAESSLREDLQRERERADRLEGERVRREQAERERDELRRQLEALQETQDASETTAEGVSGGETPPTDTDEPRRSSWWRRFFGFE